MAKRKGHAMCVCPFNSWWTFRLLPLFWLYWIMLLQTYVYKLLCWYMSSVLLHIDLGMELLGQVQFSCSVMFDSLWPHGLQHARLPCPSPTPRAYSNMCLLSLWCHQPSHPLSSLFPPAFNLSQHQGLFQWVSSSHQVAKVLELQLQHQSFQWIFRTDFL